MVLLVTPSNKAADCAAAMVSATAEQVKVASSLRQALVVLRKTEFSAVVLDEAALALEPEEADVTLQHLGTAVPVFLSFGVSGIQRVCRELKVALRRRDLESSSARRFAEQVLRSQLRNKLTALLLSCELALESRNLPSGAETRIRTACDLARELRTILSA